MNALRWSRARWTGVAKNVVWHFLTTMNHIEQPTSLDVVTVLNWTDNSLTFRVRWLQDFTKLEALCKLKNQWIVCLSRCFNLMMCYDDCMKKITHIGSSVIPPATPNFDTASKRCTVVRKGHQLFPGINTGHVGAVWQGSVKLDHAV